MRLRLFCLITLSSLLTACTAAPHAWGESTSGTANKYATTARFALTPYFAHAHLNYPPKEISLLIFKNTKTLQLWAKNGGSWHYIRGYPILAASGGPGPKLRDGDHQVPEGVYRIVELNPYSRFDLSMMLNYPNSFDRSHAALDGRRKLGDDIFIHGSHFSVGCIAIGDRAIQQIFPLVYSVGLNNVKVIIAPDDLRYHQAIYGRVHPKWLPQLYSQIRSALRPYS